MCHSNMLGPANPTQNESGWQGRWCRKYCTYCFTDTATLFRKLGGVGFLVLSHSSVNLLSLHFFLSCSERGLQSQETCNSRGCFFFFFSWKPLSSPPPPPPSPPLPPTPPPFHPLPYKKGNHTKQDKEANSQDVKKLKGILKNKWLIV